MATPNLDQDKNRVHQAHQKQRRKRWARYARIVLKQGRSPDDAAQVADIMLAKEEARFK